MGRQRRGFRAVVLKLDPPPGPSEPARSRLPTTVCKAGDTASRRTGEGRDAPALPKRGRSWLRRTFICLRFVSRSGLTTGSPPSEPDGGVRLVFDFCGREAARSGISVVLFGPARTPMRDLGAHHAPCDRSEQQTGGRG